MERKVGTISRGVRCPIIRENDNLADIVVESVLDAAKSEGFELRDRDVISVTESIVARAQGNYASIDAIAEDVKAKLGGETIGVIFPILLCNVTHLQITLLLCLLIKYFSTAYKAPIELYYTFSVLCNIFFDICLFTSKVQSVLKLFRPSSYRFFLLSHQAS